jgi:hypothetical protein
MGSEKTALLQMLSKRSAVWGGSNCFVLGENLLPFLQAVDESSVTFLRWHSIWDLDKGLFLSFTSSTMASKMAICFQKSISICGDNIVILQMVAFSHSSCFPFLFAWNEFHHLSPSCESSYHLPCNLATKPNHILTILILILKIGNHVPLKYWYSPTQCYRQKITIHTITSAKTLNPTYVDNIAS